MAGSMANAISNELLVIALGQAGYLASFGAGGVPPARLTQAIETIQNKLPEGPYAFNLIHSPQEPILEQRLWILIFITGFEPLKLLLFCV